MLLYTLNVRRISCFSAGCYDKCVQENAWCKDDTRSWCDKWGKGFKDYCYAKCTCGEPKECPKPYGERATGCA